MQSLCILVWEVVVASVTISSVTVRPIIVHMNPAPAVQRSAHHTTPTQPCSVHIWSPESSEVKQRLSEQKNRELYQVLDWKIRFRVKSNIFVIKIESSTTWTLSYCDIKALMWEVTPTLSCLWSKQVFQESSASQVCENNSETSVRLLSSVRWKTSNKC